MHPDVDLVVVFRASSKTFSRQQAKEDAQHAEQQYTRLLDTLRKAGIQAVGRRGERQGQLLVLLRCSSDQLARLIQRERHSDFLYGLSSSTLPSVSRELDIHSLSPAERLRLVHSYVTSTAVDGGLGITPEAKQWNRVESVMALHDPEFNELWLHSIAKRQVRFEQLDTIRSQFGEAVAFYFAFLVSYTTALGFIAAAGLAFYYFGNSYSVLYSSLLFLWSIVFVEHWRIHQRTLSVRWGTQGVFRVETRRAQYNKDFSWWKRELRMLASTPVVLLFAGILFALLTGIFVFEAFVTTLYTGPGHEYVSFLPTVLFVAVIPQFISLYQSYAKSFTDWENHRHQSSYDYSLTIKTFALSAMVAYLGLALSAFVYVPFGEPVMNYVQSSLFKTSASLDSAASAAFNATNNVAAEKGPGAHKLFESDSGTAHSKLNRGRLQSQMFAYTVTNQVINTFTEVGLPFILRALDAVRSGRGAGKRRPSYTKSGTGTPARGKKRVGFEDEKNGVSDRGEREFLERVRREVALPEYNLFEDYSEMVTQFGYVALWSTIWPLAPVMALLNNLLELRSDAFKIVTHCRHPLPKRADTIGPWLDCLSFLTWLAALTNSALVYLFRPVDQTTPLSTAIERDHAVTVAGLSTGDISEGTRSTRNLLVSALLIALGASHGYIVLRVVVRHVLERLVWKGSKEEAQVERAAREVKETYLKNVEGEVGFIGADSKMQKKEQERQEATKAFWEYDEGPDEIGRAVKEA